MISLIANNLTTIESHCKKHKISKLWLFGSALNDESFRKDSDIDFLIEYDDGGKFSLDFYYFDHLWGLKQDLISLLGRKVDVIEYHTFKNPYFRESVEATKQLIYAKEQEILV